MLFNIDKMLIDFLKVHQFIIHMQHSKSDNASNVCKLILFFFGFNVDFLLGHAALSCIGCQGKLGTVIRYHSEFPNQMHLQNLA